MGGQIEVRQKHCGHRESRRTRKARNLVSAKSVLANAAIIQTIDEILASQTGYSVCDDTRRSELNLS